MTGAMMKLRALVENTPGVKLVLIGAASPSVAVPL
jgi:hypothetical protein